MMKKTASTLGLTFESYFLSKEELFEGKFRSLTKTGASPTDPLISDDIAVKKKILC